MLASDVLTLGAAIFGLLTSIVGSSACFYNSFRTNRINLSILKVKVHNLETLIDRLQQKLNGVDVLKPDPSPWIERAKAFLTAVLISDFESRLTENHANGGICNFWCQCGAARLVEEKIEAVDLLVEDGKMILQTITIKGTKQPDVSIVGYSREVIRQKIWDQISHEKGVGVVCIHGVAGVGKTAMAAVIHNQALIELTSFDNVIWVNIEYGSGLRHVQEEIANRLGIDLSTATDNVARARLIQSALLQNKKFLLILDSMWQPFSIQDIGIPVPIGGSKLIVTSRICSICRKTTSKIKSKSKEFYEIKPLCDVEAWDLFKGEIGSNITNLEREALEMARVAVRNLDGIPVAIKMLAETLSEIHNDIPKALNALWKEELRGLGKSTSIVGGKGKELIDCFKSSFVSLNDISLSCLIYCTLFPKGHFIKTKELIEYWLSEELLGPVSSLQESLKLGREIVSVLKDSHLLENVYGKGREESVKMLNVVRFVAMDFLMESGQWFYVRCGSSLNVLPTVTDWPKEVERASFVQNHVTALVGIPNCKKLSTLLLQENPLSSNHNIRFFSKMPNLKVLDLSHTGISSLPTSLSNLRNLRALFLRHCSNLKSLPALSNLQRLMVMDLFGTPLEKLPEGMSSLTNLRCLDLSQTQVEVFPTQVVGKLIQIEELLLLPNVSRGYMWGSNDVITQQAGASVEELVGLKKLVVLHLAFLNTKVFKNYVMKMEKSSCTPCSFRFYVGGLLDGDTLGENSVVVIGDYQVMLPEKTCELYLMMCSEPITSIKLDGLFRDLRIVDMSDFDGISYLFTNEMLVCLKRLRKICVKRCTNMLGIIHPVKESTRHSITLLELTVIVLFNLPKLENICHGEVLNCPSLRGLKVWNCDTLKLPEVLLGPSNGFIEIKGDRQWIEKVKVANHSLNSVFKFNEASVPAKLSSTPRVKERQPGDMTMKRQQVPRRFALEAFSLRRSNPKPGGETNYAITETNQRKTETNRGAWDILKSMVTGGSTSSRRSTDGIEVIGSPQFEDGKFRRDFYRSNSSRSDP